MKKLALALISATAIMANASAAAPAPAITFDTLNYIGYTTTWNLGFEFVAQQAIEVTALGSLTTGIGAQPVQIGLWDSTQHLLASAAVTQASYADRQFSYADINRVQLTAGAHYFVAAVGYTTFGFSPRNAATSPLISYVRDAWNADGATLSFPNATTNFTQLKDSGFYGANLLLSAVPEPASYAMLLAGLVLVAGMANRRQRTR